MSIERFGIKRALGSDDIAILALLDEVLVPLENRPSVYLIGDQKSWFQEAGHIFDAHRRADGLNEIRVRLHKKLERLLKLADLGQRPLIRKMQIAITRADGALIELALLVGLKPSEGLYDELTKIMAIYGDEMG